MCLACKDTNSILSDDVNRAILVLCTYMYVTPILVSTHFSDIMTIQLLEYAIPAALKKLDIFSSSRISQI